MTGIKALAGHDHYFLPRSVVKPSDSLRKLIFPFVESTLEQLKPDQVTARSFLMLLSRLRDVLLQDAALFMDAGLDHIIFKQGTFD